MVKDKQLTSKVAVRLLWKAAYNHPDLASKFERFREVLSPVDVDTPIAEQERWLKENWPSEFHYDMFLQKDAVKTRIAVDYFLTLYKYDGGWPESRSRPLLGTAEAEFFERISRAWNILVDGRSPFYK